MATRRLAVLVVVVGALTLVLAVSVYRLASWLGPASSEPAGAPGMAGAASVERGAADGMPHRPAVAEEGRSEPLEGVAAPESGWERSVHTLDQPEAEVPVVIGDVEPLPDAEAGALLMRALGLMSQGSVTASGWQPPDELWDLVERNVQAGAVPPAFSTLYNRVIRHGHWEAVGTALPVRRLGEPRMVRGRAVDTRELYVLVRSSPGDEVEWYQVKVRADFLHYLDGRVLISLATLGAVEINRLDPDLVPRYRSVHQAL